MNEQTEYCDCGEEMKHVGIYVKCPVCDNSADDPCTVCGEEKNEYGHCKCEKSYR